MTCKPIQTSQGTWKGVIRGQARILVTGVGGNVAQGILKALRASGLAEWVVGTDVNPLAAGLYLIDQGYTIPPAHAPECFDVLRDIIRREKIDLILVGADQETIHFSRHRSRLEAGTSARIVVAPHALVQKCHDKWLTAKWLKRLGIPHPFTVRSDDASGLEALTRQMGYPLIAKPRRGYAGRNVFLIKHPKALGYALEAIGPEGVVQTYVGDPENEYTAAVFSSRPPKNEAIIVMKRELLQGTSYRIEPCRDQVLINIVKSWADRMGVPGPCNIQFRMTGMGPICFEVNARFSGTAGVRYLFGYNDVEMAVRAFIFGEKIEQPAIKPGVVLRYWEEYFIPDTDFAALKKNHQLEGRRAG